MDRRRRERRERGKEEGRPEGGKIKQIEMISSFPLLSHCLDIVL